MLVRRAIVSLAFLLALAPFPSAALPVTQPFGGTITVAEPGNPLGVGVGSPIFGSATYNDATVNPVGLSIVLFADHPSHQLSLTIGSRTFQEGDHNEMFGGLASLRFQDGDLFHVSLVAVFEEASQQFLFEADGDRLYVAPILLFDPNGFPVLGPQALAGTLDFSPAIPEPPVGLLLAVALLGVGVAASARSSSGA